MRSANSTESACPPQAVHAGRTGSPTGRQVSLTTRRPHLNPRPRLAGEKASGAGASWDPRVPGSQQGERRSPCPQAPPSQLPSGHAAPPAARASGKCPCRQRPPSGDSGLGQGVISSWVSGPLGPQAQASVSWPVALPRGDETVCDRTRSGGPLGPRLPGSCVLHFIPAAAKGTRRTGRVPGALSGDLVGERARCPRTWLTPVRSPPPLRAGQPGMCSFHKHRAPTARGHSVSANSTDENCPPYVTGGTGVS